MADAIKTRKLQPIAGNKNAENCICSRCRSINPFQHSFCTNCGWPVHETQELLQLYHFRDKHRKDLLRQYATAILQARVMLYIIGALCLSGIGFLLSERDDRIILFLLTFIMAVLFVLLARWSIDKPFTALMVSFVVVITFSTISLLASLQQTLTTLNGVYMIMLTMIVVYFLLRGTQAAYKADLINEELEIT